MADVEFLRGFARVVREGGLYHRDKVADRIDTIADRLERPEAVTDELIEALEAGGTRIWVLLGAERDAMPAHVVKAFQDIAKDMTAALSKVSPLIVGPK